MDDTLKFASPNVNLEEVNALNHNRSITFVNTFVSRTADFLNRYAAKSEEQLSTNALEMQKLEIAISIIEEKLASIPVLKDFKPTSNVSASMTEHKPEPTQTSDGSLPGQQAPAPPTAEEKSEDKEATARSVEAPAMAENFVKVKDDARYAKYFKMLNVGVVKMAIENKMRQEGLNPDLLDTPDAPCPSPDDADSDNFSDDSGSTASNFSD